MRRREPRKHHASFGNLAVSAKRGCVLCTAILNDWRLSKPERGDMDQSQDGEITYELQDNDEIWFDTHFQKFPVKFNLFKSGYGTSSSIHLALHFDIKLTYNRSSPF
jgi:hypothetical protein